MPPSTTIKPLVLMQHAESAQKTANYETGLKQIRDFGFWDYQNPEKPFNPDGLSETETAGLLLSAGRLYGFYGIVLKNAQEISKDLLTAAYNIFIKLDLREQQLLCANYLALCYWRMGAVDEAGVWLSTAQAFRLPARNAARLHTFIVESLIFHTSGRHNTILEHLTRESKNFTDCGDLYLLGLFHMNLGLARGNCGDASGALHDMELACDVFRESGHPQYLCYCENNMSFFYRAQGQIDQAFEYAKRSKKTAETIADVRQKGCVEDTLSSLYFDIGDYKTALEYAHRSVEILEKIECYRYLVDSYKTLLKTLWKLDRIEEALEVYAKAWKPACDFCGEKGAEDLTQLLSNLTRKGFTEQILEEKIGGGESLRLRFSEGFEPAGKVTPIQLATNAYANLGFNGGSIVVAEEAEVKNDNFVAAVYRDECYLGFLYSYEGIISLEINDELLFEPSDEVKILGKIIGHCPNPPDAEGYYQVVSFE